MARLRDQATEREQMAERLEKIERFTGYRLVLGAKYRDPAAVTGEHEESRELFWGHVADASRAAAELREALGLPPNPDAPEIPADVDVDAALEAHRRSVEELKARFSSR